MKQKKDINVEENINNDLDIGNEFIYSPLNFSEIQLQNKQSHPLESSSSKSNFSDEEIDQLSKELSFKISKFYLDIN
jgi:hypothetical protein